MTIPNKRKLLLSFSGTLQGLLDHIASAIYLSETIDEYPDDTELCIAEYQRARVDAWCKEHPGESPFYPL